MFAVIRHPDPDIEGLGFCTEETLESHRAKGWVRISEYRNEPGDFHKPDYADVYDDLDADEESPADAAESDEPDAEPESEPATDEPASEPAETTEEIES